MTITYLQRRVTIGSAPDATIQFPSDDKVSEHHAEIEFVEPECAFHLNAREGQVFVNCREVREIVLGQDDLIEIGLGGPKVRFRIHYEPGAVCKPVRQMLSDAMDVGGASGVLAGGQSLRRDLIHHSTWQTKLGASIFLVVLAFGAAILGAAIVTARMTKAHETMRQQTEAISAEVTRIRDELQREHEDFLRQQAGHATQTQLDTLRSDLARRAEVVESLVAGNDALRRVLDEYSRGVCLIYGTFTFHPPVDGDSAPILNSNGAPLELAYFGSGFLVSSEGIILTNRHIAEPWWNNDAVSGLLEKGMLPKFVVLRAYFPGLQPATIAPSSIHVSTEGVDIAIMHVAPDAVQGVPLLPLHTGDVRDFRGSHVILLGYPTGLNAILARTESDVVDEIRAAFTDTESLLASLVERSLIAPVVTQGALNEVRDRRLVYDAATTSGGSGGPVFASDGTVIGINFAITRDFGGSNFGVPIRFARPLLP